MSRNYHKRDKFLKTFSMKEYLKKAIKESTNNQTIDDKELDKICSQTDLQKEFDECLKPLVKNQVNSNYDDFNLEKFVHLNQYLFK